MTVESEGGFAPYPGQQTAFMTATEDEVFYGGAAGGGKAATLSTLIPTPAGWITFGSAVVGDVVFSASGIPVAVVDVSRVIEDEDCYRLSFSDGTSIEAGENHLWLTTTEKERGTQWRRSEEFRSSRRAKRKSRATGRNIRPHVAALNSARTYEYKSPETGNIRTTKEIVATLLTARGARNHAIEQHLPLELPVATLPVPPYTMGAWLGDGTSASGQVSGIDNGVFENIESEGFSTGAYASGTSRHIHGLSPLLRSAGVLNNKHIPPVYLRASLPQRLALLHGLMDTDGWCEKDGSCKIALTRKELFDGVVELLRTLGVIVNVTVGQKSATNGSPGNSTKCWTACFVTGLPAFRLERKLARQNRKPQERYLRRFIVAAENLGPRPMRCIQVSNPDGMFLAGEQFIPTHNSLLGMMKFFQQLVVEHQRFRDGQIRRSKAWGLYLRRKTPDLAQAIEESYRHFNDFDEDAHFHSNTHTWTFPSCGGAKFQFGHMQHETDRFNYKSNAYSYVYADELTEFTQVQWEYIQTRIRSDDPVLVNMLQACAGSNPDGEGLLWVRDRYIENKEPMQVYRTKYVLSNGMEKFKDQIFIPAKLSDNPPLYESGAYEVRLRGLTPEIREALLNGNWYYASGAFLARVWDSSKHVCEDHPVPRGAQVFRSGDYGYGKPGSVTWWYLSADGVLTAFFNLYLTEHTPEMWSERIKEVEMEFGLWNEAHDHSEVSGPLDAKCWNRESSGTSIAAKFASKGVRWYRAANRKPESRKNGAVELISRMQARVPYAHDPGNRDADLPGIRWMKRCQAPIRTLPILRPDPHNREDVDTDGEDHCYDETRYMCLARPRIAEKESDSDEDEVDNVVPMRGGAVGAWGR